MQAAAGSLFVNLTDLQGARAAQAGNSRAIAIDPRGSRVNVPLEERTGAASRVWFTRDLSADGLRRIYAAVAGSISGKTPLKLHTGEKNGPNIIPREWVKALMTDLPAETKIVETNTLYEGDRYTTEKHRETLKVNGWTFCPVDILDEFGTAELPVEGGKHLTKISVGAHILDYDSLIVLTHFKGHTSGGFGGSVKNIGIGIADGRIGKAQIHTRPGQGTFSIKEDEFMERMVESAKATIDHFAPHIVYINVLRNMSIDCDCAGVSAAPPETPDIGILASTDILAIDQASVDFVYGQGASSAALRNRIETRHGLRQLSYLRELGLGNDKYELVRI